MLLIYISALFSILLYKKGWEAKEIRLENTFREFEPVEELCISISVLILFSIFIIFFIPFPAMHYLPSTETALKNTLKQKQPSSFWFASVILSSP
jgi:hypothetical protein